MKALPFSVRFELSGWELFWAFREVEKKPGEELETLRTSVAEGVRWRFADTAAISAYPPVTAMRRLFKAAGCDPSRYRPASEALLRRLVKGNDLPAIQPLVDLNNCLSAEMAVPCCVMCEGTFGSSLVFRAGTPGESYQSLRGPFQIVGKPVLADEEGPLDTPITGNERVKVLSDTRRAWLVAYLPAGEVSVADTWQALDRFSEPAGITATRHRSST